MEILMSIHGKWADLIYQGKKTVELRKTAPQKSGKIDATVYVYNTDCKSVDGRFFVSEVVEIDEITEELSAKSCVPMNDIVTYKGDGKLYAWIIEEADEFEPDWLQLEDLGAKRAPQSWQYAHGRRQ